MERAGKVVGHGTAVVLLGHWHQASQPDQEQQEELKWQSSSEDSEEEGWALPRRPSLRRGGTWATSCGPEKRGWTGEYTKTLLQQRLPSGTQPSLKVGLQFVQTLIDNCRGIFHWTCYFRNTLERPRVSRLGRKTPNENTIEWALWPHSPFVNYGEDFPLKALCSREGENKRWAIPATCGQAHCLKRKPPCLKWQLHLVCRSFYIHLCI